MSSKLEVPGKKETPFSNRGSRKEEMKEKVKTLVEDLADLTEEAQNTDEFQKWLEVQSKFHQYSYHNTMLIMVQYPEATKVAGFKKWKEEFDRYVKQGETAIWIWAPLTRKKCPECGTPKKYHEKSGCDRFDDEEKDERDWVEGLAGFKPVPVFDISQTEGKPLPEIDADPSGGNPKILDAVKEAAEPLEIDLEVSEPENWNRNCKGFARFQEAKVEYREPSPTIRTILHEYGHITAGHTTDGPLPSTHSKSRKEVEGEAIAYIVGRNLGLDMDNCSFYLAAYDGDSEMLKDSLNTITGAAEEILNAIDTEHPSTAQS